MIMMGGGGGGANKCQNARSKLSSVYQMLREGLGMKKQMTYPFCQGKGNTYRYCSVRMYRKASHLPYTKLQKDC